VRKLFLGTDEVCPLFCLVPKTCLNEEYFTHFLLAGYQMGSVGFVPFVSQKLKQVIIEKNGGKV
jgi:hypothetical protein